MNLDLNLLGKAADVLYIKLYNPDCQSQLIDCFYVKQCVALGCVVDCFKLSGWVFEEKKKKKKVWEMWRKKRGGSSILTITAVRHLNTGNNALLSRISLTHMH